MRTPRVRGRVHTLFPSRHIGVNGVPFSAYRASDMYKAHRVCIVKLTQKDNREHVKAAEERQGRRDEVVDRHLPWSPPRVAKTRQRIVRVHSDDKRLPCCFVLYP